MQFSSGESYMVQFPFKNTIMLNSSVFKTLSSMVNMTTPGSRSDDHERHCLVWTRIQ